MVLIIATSTVLLGTSTALAGSPRTKAVVDHVSDGDTIKVAIGAREKYVRFIGIDTPEVYETSECGGEQASASMNRMVKPGDRVTLVRDRTQGNRDDYGRLLRYVELRGRDLGEKQVRKANRGVWRLCGGFPRRG